MKKDEEKRIKIAYLSARDAQDRKTWSGTYYYMAQALQKHCGEVSYIGPLDASQEQRIGKIINKGSQVFLKKIYMYQHSFMVTKKYAQVAKQKLAGRHFDVIVAPAGAQTTAFLETDIPIVLVDDAPYALLYDYYALYSNLLKRSIYELDTVEALAIKKASCLAYSSAWAAQSAIEDYHADSAKVHTIPFGANFEDIPPREAVLKKERSERCRLLFVGVSWERKGGDVAFETLLALEKMGIEAELTICGCVPPSGKFSHEHLTVIPFLDKNDPQQRRELAHLYEQSHFLLLPTKSDCAPMVCCEANAFGLPVIIRQTGGVASLIRDGDNGFLLPYSAGGEAYAAVIAQAYQDDRRYRDLVMASREAFESRLNWDAWGCSMKELLTELLATQSLSK